MALQVSVGQALIVLAIAISVSSLFLIIRNLYFHPLASYPGPRLWAVSRLPYVLTLIKGDLTHRTKELHDRYGPVIRLAPNELSFIEGQAWHDIYAHHQGRPNFPKNPLWMAPDLKGVHSILSAGDADHARHRRLIAHAFSEKALRQQEYILRKYIDLLICRLTEAAKSTNPAVDFVQWFNFTTFDIIGDLSFGVSFHCLEESRYHGWVITLATQFKAAAMLVALRFYGLLEPVIKLIPTRFIKRREEHIRYGSERVERRLKQEGVDAQRNDFMTYVLRYNDEKGMSVPEIEATFRVFVLAGSETTATTLSGIMLHLCKYQDAYDALAKEIRNSFAHESEICAERVGQLKYLNATIEEGLRLCSPVALGMFRVVPAGGAEVSGRWIPGGVFVSASGYSSNRSVLNFPDQPEKFIPSRWLTSGNASSQPSAFNPFSLGPRNCVGRSLAYLEMRLILARLVWHFDFEASGELPKWEDQKTYILWEKRPLNLKIKIRDQ